MTSTVAPRQETGPGADRIAALLLSPASAMLCGMALYALMQWPWAPDVWAAGLFMDTDDAMRLRQARALMAGRPWFDAIEPAMNWPDGVRLHWSHVVDLGVIGLIKLFGLVFDPVHAERAARIVFPALCFAATLALLTGLARRMTGPAGAFAVAVIAPLSLFVTQFSAGRIDHHGPQIALLIAMVSATLLSLDPARARAAVWAGLAAAASFAISVENLPFVAVVAAIYALAVAWRAELGRAAAGFGLAFALGCAAAYAVFADHAAGPVCDALSTFHLALAGFGGLGLAAIGGLATRLPTGGRWAAVAALGLAAALLAKFAFPQCLADPLASLPPLMVERWLSRVGEARPLLQHAGGWPLRAGFGLPMLLGLLALLAAAVAARGLERARWSALAALVAVGLAAAFWQVRASSSTIPLALIGAGVVAAAMARRVAGHDSALFMLVPCFAVLPFVGLFWVAAVPSPVKAASPWPDVAGAPAQEGRPPVCWSPPAMRGVATLPPGLVLTSIDPGSLLLALTHHRVVGGAYHRNVAGDVDVIAALTGPLDEARAIAARRKVDYVAVCADLTDMRLFADDAPQGLAARLLRGTPPDWLEPIPLEGPWKIYRPR